MPPWTSSTQNHRYKAIVLGKNAAGALLQGARGGPPPHRKRSPTPAVILSLALLAERSSNAFCRILLADPRPGGLMHPRRLPLPLLPHSFRSSNSENLRPDLFPEVLLLQTQQHYQLLKQNSLLFGIFFRYDFRAQVTQPISGQTRPSSRGGHVTRRIHPFALCRKGNAFTCQAEDLSCHLGACKVNPVTAAQPSWDILFPDLSLAPWLHNSL